MRYAILRILFSNSFTPEHIPGPTVIFVQLKYATIYNLQFACINKGICPQ